MNITRAVITAASPSQRSLPLQRIVDRDGVQKSVLQIIAEEALRAGVEQIGVVVCPGDQRAFAQAAGPLAERLHFVEQAQPRGYGHAILAAAAFTANQPFLHLVGDHLYLSADGYGCARRLVELASAESCAVSAVQPSRESQLPYYGVVGGRPLTSLPDVYAVEDVLEKPTPTEAEQRLLVPGLRVGHYLCFFGMHVLTPAVLEILAEQARADAPLPLSPALAELARRERYLALANLGRRYDINAKYGLLTAQLALGLAGSDRDELLAGLIELLAVRP